MTADPLDAPTLDDGWQPFDPSCLLKARSDLDPALSAAIARCSRVRWAESGSTGDLSEALEAPDSDWVWDEELAVSFHLNDSIFIVDFQTRRTQVRAFRIEIAVQLTLEIDAR